MINLEPAHLDNMVQKLNETTSRAKRLLPWIAGKAKTADTLKGVQHDAIVCLCRTEDKKLLHSVSVVSFSLDEAAKAVFKGQRQAATDARNSLVAAHIIEIARKGTKGVATLYVFPPLPDKVTKESESVTQNERDRVTNATECGHDSAKMGSYQHAADQGNTPCFNKHSTNIQERECAAENDGTASRKEYGVPHCPNCYKQLTFTANGFGCPKHGKVSKNDWIFVTAENAQ